MISVRYDLLYFVPHKLDRSRFFLLLSFSLLLLLPKPVYVSLLNDMVIAGILQIVISFEFVFLSHPSDLVHLVFKHRVRHPVLYDEIKGCPE